MAMNSTDIDDAPPATAVGSMALGHARRDEGCLSHASTMTGNLSINQIELLG
jgi:hypothetical protein